MISECLKERALPAVWPDKNVPFEIRRNELVRILEENEYGKVRREVKSVSYETFYEDPKYLASKGSFKKVMIRLVLQETDGRGEDSFSFPVTVILPRREGKHPFVVHISFMFTEPGYDPPIEEMLEQGIAYLGFNYQEVTRDDRASALRLGEHTDGIYPLLNAGQEDDPAGKIAVWAWAASRVLDYAATLPELDMTRAAVAGHSRLGKTALVAGMEDPRFQYIFANASGAGGAALFRGMRGEKLEDLVRVFPYWFNRKFASYVDRTPELPYDQHFLIAACAPRKVYVGAGDDDLWADEQSMYSALAAASEVYEALGRKGFIAADRLPETGDVFTAGDLGFHLRKGAHYLSREDWLHFLSFMNA